MPGTLLHLMLTASELPVPWLTHSICVYYGYLPLNTSTRIKKIGMYGKMCQVFFFQIAGEELVLSCTLPQRRLRETLLLWSTSDLGMPPSIALDSTDGLGATSVV